MTKLGKEAAAILPNVNRWRGQLGLAPVDEAGLAELTKEIKVNGETGIQVDMTGIASKGGPAMPIAKAPPMGVKRSFNYQKPEGWMETPHPEQGMVPREALFQVADGGEKAEVSVTALGGGRRPRRERRALGGPDRRAGRRSRTDWPSSPRSASPGARRRYIDLIGKKGRMLGAIVSVGDKTWFFKMTGPPEVVEKHKAEFEAFLKSVKFAGGPGGEQ